MKKLFTALLLSFVFITSYAQDNDYKMELAKQDLAKYSNGILNGYEAVSFNSLGFAFINKQNVKFQGDSVIVWEALYSLIEDEFKYNLMIYQREYNCRENILRIVYQGPSYKNQKMINSGLGAVYMAAKPIIPNSTGESMFKYACSLRNNY